jgi:hypothetical protein
LFFFVFFFEFFLKKNLSLISTFVLAYFLLEQFCGFLQHWFSWFLIFTCFSSPSSLLRAFLALLGFYSSIWFFCNLRKKLLFFPFLTYYTHLVFFSLNFVGV